MTQPTLSGVFGRLYWSELRDLVAEMQFRGLDIELLEGRGWLDRRFTFKGEPDAIAMMARAIDAFERKAS